MQDTSRFWKLSTIPENLDTQCKSLTDEIKITKKEIKNEMDTSQIEIIYSDTDT